MKFHATLTAAAIGLLTSVVPLSAQEAPQVIASIKPLHSLVAGVMEGVGEPFLLVGGGDSPHTYAMRPSDAEALANASAIFWIGNELEAFLERPIQNVGRDIRSVALIDAPGLVLYHYENDVDHEHDSHGHEDDHAHDEAHHGHDHEEAHHDHHHSGLDGHIWLDPRNARAMVETIASTLAEIDPDNAAAYRDNADRLSERLSALETDIDIRLTPHRDVPFFTFHESFRYFSERFALASRGAITISPERQPGAHRLGEIRAEIGGRDRSCVFTEPQFPPRLVDMIVEGTPAQTGVVDPLGADLADGPELYFQLLQFNADAFADCFSATM